MSPLSFGSAPRTAMLVAARAALGATWRAEYERLSLDLLTALPSASNVPFVLGLTGAQGTGKSTLAAHLQALVVALGHAVAVLSLDDLYLPRSERIALAASVHPLLHTRGVPGTHDVSLGLRLLAALTGRAGAVREVAVPRFDKGLDDRLPVSQWRTQRLPVALVIVEGWCLAIPPQSDGDLQLPVNELERNEDSTGRWRRWVNERLALDYLPLFACFDAVVALLPPDFDAVRRWRGEQELGLPAERRMNGDELTRFIAHYERLTRHGLATWPKHADWCVWLAQDHRIGRVSRRPAGQ